jgi:hypothetical protein
MQAMRGFTAVASRRALSAGTLLVFGGGLALYQMTSLVLAPAGSRELHLSLTIPAVEDELSEPKSSSVNLSLGTLVAPTPTASVSVRSTGGNRASGAPAPPRRVVPTPTPVPVGSQPPTPHPSHHPVAPIVGLPDEPAGVVKSDEAD